MKTKNLILLVTFLGVFNALGQAKKKCDCLKTTFETGKESEVFDFKGGKKIMLCGSINSENDAVNYFEFILFQCGKTSAIDFWDASKICDVSMKSDTLFVSQMIDMPIGEKFENELTPWKIDKIFYIDDQLSIKKTLNRDFEKYDDTQIESIIKLFELSKPAAVDAKKMQLAAKLFVGTLCGNQTCRAYLTDFKVKFKVAGMPEEAEYNELLAKLELWDR